VQANSKNFSYSRNLFFDILAHIKNNTYLCSEFLRSKVSHNFCCNDARRCETMGIFYCLIVDINNIVETVVNIKDIINRLENFVKRNGVNFCCEISVDFYYNIDTIFNEREKRYFSY
jgi:hypothetical protein